MIDDIKSELSKIKYPGFNRDIVSFGIIKDIKVVKDDLYIVLSIDTENQKNKELIVQEINKKIKEKFEFNNIKINFLDPNINEPVQNQLNIKKIIAISSCKGGVGKSTVALNLAIEMSKKYKVGLLDLDIYGPSLSTLVNHHEQPEFTNNRIKPVSKFGIKLMSFGFINNEKSPTIWRGPMVSRMTQQFFDNVDWGDLDLLILDLPPGTGDIQLTLVQKIALNGAVIITTPQKLSHIDVQKGSDMFKKVNTNILGIVENMSGLLLNGEIKSDKNIKLLIDNHDVLINEDGTFSIEVDVFKGDSGQKESRRLDLPLLGKIPIDSKISECCDVGNPYVLAHNNTRIQNIYSNIANQIVKSLNIE